MKILDAWQSEIHFQFARKISLICVITSGRCLEKSNDFKHCFGLDVEATVESGHRVNIHTYIYFIYARNLQSSCRANVFEKIS